jgi:hypothetical protein
MKPLAAISTAAAVETPPKPQQPDAREASEPSMVAQNIGGRSAPCADLALGRGRDATFSLVFLTQPRKLDVVQLPSWAVAQERTFPEGKVRSYRQGF